MFKKIKLLFKLKSWLTSKTLWAGGAVGAIATIQGIVTWLQGPEAATLLDILGAIIPLPQGLILALLIGFFSLVILVLRALTEWGLDEKDKVNQ